MKIAISSEGKTIDSKISEKGGRAPYYIVFEGKSLVETIKNPFAMGGGGAGPAVAYMLAEKDVKLVITGKVGDKMKNALEGEKIDFKEINDKTVEEALNY